MLQVLTGSGNVGRIDIILILFWLMTFEASFGGIGHDWLLGISSRPRTNDTPRSQ
jgi:hypothetical protein